MCKVSNQHWACVGTTPYPSHSDWGPVPSIGTYISRDLIIKFMCFLKYVVIYKIFRHIIYMTDIILNK